MGRRYPGGPFDPFEQSPFSGLQEFRIPRPPRRVWIGLAFVGGGILLLFVAAPLIGFLTETQWFQALGLGSYLASFPIRRVYSSPLERAVETARLAASRLPEELEIDVRDDLLEAEWGKYIQGIPRGFAISGADVENHVERGFGGPADGSEAGVSEDRAESGFAGLGSEACGVDAALGA